MAISKNKTRKYSKSSSSDTTIKKIILAVIFISMLVVIIAVVCSFVLDPQKRVPEDISKLSAEYYEDYFYENLTHSARFQDDKIFNSVMEKYHTYGLAPIRLSDLLLYDNQKNANYREYLTKYCDENATTIKFYPESPYGKKDYRVDITYACNF